MAFRPIRPTSIRMPIQDTSDSVSPQTTSAPQPQIYNSTPPQAPYPNTYNSTPPPALSPTGAPTPNYVAPPAYTDVQPTAANQPQHVPDPAILDQRAGNAPQPNMIYPNPVEATTPVRVPDYGAGAPHP